MEPVVKYRKNRIIMEDEDVECQIVADEIEGLEPYIKKLFEWATIAWDYNAVENWNTDEYNLVHTQDGYFKIHKLGRDDKEGLFAGKYADSPDILANYDDIEIHAYVYLKTTREEFNKLARGNEGGE